MRSSTLEHALLVRVDQHRDDDLVELGGRALEDVDVARASPGRTIPGIPRRSWATTLQHDGQPPTLSRGRRARSGCRRSAGALPGRPAVRPVSAGPDAGRSTTTTVPVGRPSRRVDSAASIAVTSVDCRRRTAGRRAPDPPAGTRRRPAPPRPRRRRTVAPATPERRRCCARSPRPRGRSDSTNSADRGSPRQRLEPSAPDPAYRSSTSMPVKSMPRRQHVEQRLAHPVGGRAGCPVRTCCGTAIRRPPRRPATMRVS